MKVMIIFIFVMIISCSYRKDLRNDGEEKKQILVLKKDIDLDEIEQSFFTNYKPLNDDHIFGIIGNDYSPKPVNTTLPSFYDKITENRIALITYKSKLIDLGTTYKLRLNSLKLKDGENLCDKDDELKNYYNYPYVDSSLTGFAINDSIVLSAGHIKMKADEIAIVYGYYGNKQEYIIDKKNVFFVKKAASPYTGAASDDYCILSVTKPVSKDHQVILQPSTQGLNLLTTKYLVAGYPLGMPLLIEKDIHVNVFNNVFFSMTADIMKGNSGSPLFYTQNNNLYVIGMVIKAFSDFSQHEGNSCYSIVKITNNDLQEGEKPLSLNINRIKTGI